VVVAIVVVVVLLGLAGAKVAATKKLGPIDTGGGIFNVGAQESGFEIPKALSSDI
jgi:hypothetical protein